ncbi:MAG: EAL domain-containing protein [Paracoccaceae bacterium]|nr:EAL domain-containing protein [Paracoccaceae bacterium]
MSIEALKSSCLDRSGDAVVIGLLTDGATETRVVYVNDAFASLSGRVVDTISGQSMGSFLEGEMDFDLNAAGIGDVCEGPEQIQNDMFVIRSDGTRIPVEVSLQVQSGLVDDESYVCAMIKRCHTASLTPSERLELQDTDLPKLKRERDDALRNSARMTSALNAYPDPFVIYDENLRLVNWNAAYAASMTDTPSDLKCGMLLGEVLSVAVENGRHPEAHGRERDWIESILSQNTLERNTQDVELKDDIHHRLFRYRSRHGDYVVIRLNSTELVRQKRAAEDAQARLIAALNAYPYPFVIYDSEDCIVVWNDAYRASMSDGSEAIEVGMHRTEVARIAIRAGKFADAAGREEEWMSDAHQEMSLIQPVQDLELAGDIHHRLLRSRVANGDLVIVRLDTTELVRQRRAVEKYAQKLELANQEIYLQATHDDLTGLGNRRLLNRKFREFEERRKKEGGEIAALHIDLDRFKQINDTMGHAAGDKVLLDVSTRIRDRVMSDEVVSRIGGDEFVVLIYVTTGRERPQTLARQLLADLARPTDFEGKECRFGVSIGIATTPVTGVDDLLTNSDIALYKAKSSGRGRLAVFDRNDLERARLHKALADDVLRGIEQNEFVPFYQPQIDVETGMVVGMEVLARWNHPLRGILAPAVFLPVATDLDVVADIDKVIFENAIKDCTNAFAGLENLPSLSFNVSAVRVNDHEIGDIKKHVQTYPGAITFELLETIFLEEEDQAFFWKLDQFRDLGLSIEIDDFGSGRASVVALQRIGPDRLKIDRRLVAPITESEGGLRLLQSIVEIGHALQMGVTAEGVETQEQARLLADVGCDRLQGYYFSSPMTLTGAVTYLNAHNPENQALKMDHGIKVEKFGKRAGIRKNGQMSRFNEP